MPACHWQSPPQVSTRLPQLPHAAARVSPGLQAPCPVQAPAAQTHAPLHVSISVPQLPHAIVRAAPGEQAPVVLQDPIVH